MNSTDVLDLDDLVSILNIPREQAKALLDAHDNYVMELSKLEGNIPVTLVITLAVALASNAGMDPYNFIRMVQEIILACAEGGPQTPDIEA